MRTLAQNGEILSVLLISGIVIGIMMIVGIHPVTGSSQAAYDQGYDTGKNDCLDGKAYNSNQGAPELPTIWSRI
jgi:hypothetical protein